METLNNISNSEINPQNNYKFDNYGIVMADSIEDLLYDKYNNKKKKKNLNNSNYSDGELYEENEDKSYSIENKSLNQFSISSSKESKVNEISISHNINLQYMKNKKNKNNTHNTNQNNNYSPKVSEIKKN